VRINLEQIATHYYPTTQKRRTSPLSKPGSHNGKNKKQATFKSDLLENILAFDGI
jgi:hypothetical protein